MRSRALSRNKESVIRHHIALVPALLLATAAGEARADLVTYNMTGTIVLKNDNAAFYTAGDHITWTLQYDRSAAGNPNGTYSVTGPTITSIIDQTNGYHFFNPSTLPSASQLGLTASVYGGVFSVTDTSYPSDYQGTLNLMSNNSGMPAPSLASLQLDSVPWIYGNYAYSGLIYSYTAGEKTADFIASVDSISSAQAPEPGSLTLLGLGAVLLAGARRCRRAPAAIAA